MAIARAPPLERLRYQLSQGLGLYQILPLAGHEASPGHPRGLTRAREFDLAPHT